MGYGGKKNPGFEGKCLKSLILVSIMIEVESSARKAIKLINCSFLGIRFKVNEGFWVD